MIPKCGEFASPSNEHNFSVIIAKEKSWFGEVVTHLACNKCGEIINTGKTLFKEKTEEEKQLEREMP